ncbi:MAG: hypothetical protein ACRELF_13555, partial [Gemmataceae bacterium]
TLQLQESWAARNGMSAVSFARTFNSFYVNTEMQRAEAATESYQVQAVPFVAVDGRFATDVGMAGGERQLISLVDFLAGWAHRQKHSP